MWFKLDMTVHLFVLEDNSGGDDDYRGDNVEFAEGGSCGVGGLWCKGG